MFVYIIRGLPGCGKTTFAKSLTEEKYIFSADDYFTKDGIYTYDRDKISEAHADCFARFKSALENADDGTKLVVANVNHRHKNMTPYIESCKKSNRSVKFFVVNLFDQKLSNEELFMRNVHGVPLEVISNFRNTWQH